MSVAIYPFAGPCEIDASPTRLRHFALAQHKAKGVITDDSHGTPPSDDVDALLHKVAVAADRAAFRRLFELYAPRIRAYLLKLTRDRQAAEDLMQETMLAIWRKAGQFDPARGPAAAWIFTIARNIWIDAWRKQKRPQADPNDPAMVSDPEPDAPHLMQMRQDRDAIHRAMARLPREQVDIIRLSFFDEASHSTIARRLGLPIGTVKSRIRLAFGRLRAALEEGP